MPAEHVLAIVGMALVTYLTRAGGLFVLGRVRLTPALERGLQAMPGCVLVSIVAPAVLAAGWAEAAAGAACLLVAARGRSLPLAMLVGVAAVWALRRLMG